MAGDKELGRRIRRHREARRLSQQELADALGVSLRSVGNWERGKTHPQSSLGAIEALFGVDLESPAPAELDPVLAAIDASELSEGNKDILRGTYRNMLRDDERRAGAAS